MKEIQLIDKERNYKYRCDVSEYLFNKIKAMVEKEYREFEDIE